MSGWFLAPALTALRDEVNKRFPDRDKSTDGALGDDSHAARKSDHNPDRTAPPPATDIVRAIDLDIGPDGRDNADLRKQVLQATIGDPRVWYVIHNGVIWSRTFGFGPRRYTGSNPHTGHIHVSLRGADGTPPDVAWDLNSDLSPWLNKNRPGTRTPSVSLAKIKDAARHPSRRVHPVHVRRVQRALIAKGIDVGAVDGVYGARTRMGYSMWQRRLRNPGALVSGIPGMDSLTRLGANRFRVER